MTANTQLILNLGGLPLIKGLFIKFLDGRWLDRNNEPLRPGLKVLALKTVQAVQRWQNNVTIQTIIEPPGNPLQDLEQLNADVPRESWEINRYTNAPKAPWARSFGAYLLDIWTPELLTFANGTVGATNAVTSLRDKMIIMRALRGEDVLPMVGLSSRTMKTKHGPKLAPAFQILSWHRFNIGAVHHPNPGTANAPGLETVDSPIDLETVDQPNPAEELRDENPF
jgi:hypothetical protein